MERELDDRRVPPDRELPDRDPVEREREDVERDELDRDELDDEPDFARVDAAFFAAVLRFVAARLRVAAPFFAAAERDFEVDPPPRALFSI